MAALLLLAAAATSGWIRPFLGDDGTVVEAAARVLCLLGAALIGKRAFRRLREGVAPETPTREALTQPDIPWLRKLQEALATHPASADSTAIATFVQLIVRPEQFRTRVAETVNTNGRAITQNVSVELVLPDSDASARYTYVPVLLPLKGELIDDFQLRDATGASLVDLSYEETIQLASAGLRLLITEAARLNGEAVQLTESVRVIELAMLQILASRGAADPHIARRKVEAAVAELQKELGVVDEHQVRRIGKYLLALSVAYPIVAIVSTDLIVANRVLIKYARTMLPTSHPHNFRGLLRLGLGLRPAQLALPVVLALTGKSYHLRVNGPPDAYVLGQYLRCPVCQELVTNRWYGTIQAVPGRDPRCRHDDDPGGRPIQNDPPHVRVRRRRGQNFVHVYMRGYATSSTKLSPIQLLIEYKEVPPGSRARAVITAMVTSALILGVAYLVALGRIPTNSDLPALMLALPAVAASWFGLTAETGSLVGPSLLARLSLIVSGTLSLSAILLYLYGDGGYTLPVSMFGVSSPWWLALTALSILNLIYISYRFALKLSYYGQLLRKSDSPALEYSLS